MVYARLDTLIPFHQHILNPRTLQTRMRTLLPTLRLLSIVCLLLAVSCRRGPQEDPFNLPDGPETGRLGDDEWVLPFPEDGLGADRGDFMNRTPVAVSISPVYFAFDSYRIAPGEIHKVQQAADHLRTNPGHVVVVEGHTDERGSREYNLALGERRALAVREALVGFGVGTDRIQTLSFGEEKPAAMGHDERSWALNRRAEFRIMR